LNNVDAVNDYFAGISYRPGIVNCSIPSYGVVSSNNDPLVDDYTIEHLLRGITPTSPGLDALPSWLFSKCSYELAGIIAYIFDYSFSNGVVPGQWKRSVITPVLKVSRPMSISQFKPISVTPILSRLAEKLVVRNWLFPAIDSTLLLTSLRSSLLAALPAP